MPDRCPGCGKAIDYSDLAEFFGIDLKQAEDERQKILKSLHPLNEEFLEESEERV